MNKSFGILAVSMIACITVVLLVQPRDTFAYREFMYGKSVNPELMCLDEHQRLLTYDFQELYKDVNAGKKTHSGYKKKCERFFNKHITQLRQDIKASKFKPKKDLPWGLPKGRPIRGETPVQTAKREFREETKLVLPQSMDVANSITEVYIGDDGEVYSATYYVVGVDHQQVTKIVLKDVIRRLTVSNEVLNAKWVNIDNLHEYLEPSKVRLIKEGLKKMKKMKDDKDI